MKQKSAIVFLASIVLITSASLSGAQALQFKVGDQVEALTYYISSNTHWVKATIIEVDSTGQHAGPYFVHYDGHNYVFDTWQPTDKVRLSAAEPIPVPTPPAVNRPRQEVRKTTGPIMVGDRLDVFNTGYTPKIPKGRGTVIEVGDGQYKISYEGCARSHDDWQDRSSVEPEATISASDPEIAFLIGSWAMFSPSYPNTVVRGGTVYREYGMGAKAPPLQIKANGSYVWYFDFGKPPVQGTWSTSAMVGERKVRGAANEGISHTLTDTGIVIKDPKGAKWKIYRWIMPGKEERITAHLMCSGETMVGSRIR